MKLDQFLDHKLKRQAFTRVLVMLYFLQFYLSELGLLSQMTQATTLEALLNILNTPALAHLLVPKLVILVLSSQETLIGALLSLVPVFNLFIFIIMIFMICTLYQSDQSFRKKLFLVSAPVGCYYVGFVGLVVYLLKMQSVAAVQVGLLYFSWFFFIVFIIFALMCVYMLFFSLKRLFEIE